MYINGNLQERVGPEFATSQTHSTTGVIGAADKNSHGTPQKGRQVRPIQQSHRVVGTAHKV